MTEIVYHPRVDDEVFESARRYERSREGLGWRFLRAVQREGSISDGPLVFPILRDGIRKCPVRLGDSLFDSFPTSSLARRRWSAMQLERIFFFLFGLAAASMLFRVIKNRGFRGAMFGAPLRKLVSEMELVTRGMAKTKLKVHILHPRDASAGPHVGVEVVHSTIGSWRMSPIALTRAEAQKLADQLSAASRESASGETHV